MKTCKKCQYEFIGARCPPCAKLYQAAYNLARKDTQKEYRAVNQDRIKAAYVIYCRANRERITKRMAAYRLEKPEKHRISNKKWKSANKDKSNAAAAAWRVANPKKINDTQKKWRAANPEKLRAQSLAWYQANKDKCREKYNNRRASKLKNGGILSRGLADKLLKLQKEKCACCKKSISSGFHIDHIIPLARGGMNIDLNSQLLCAYCNLSKGSKHPVDFMQSRGFLL